VSGGSLTRAHASVHLLAGAPEVAPTLGDVVEIDLGAAQPAGLDGLRELLVALGERRPAAVRKVAEQRQPEWNVLFPAAFPEAAPLSVMAATCSERRLHAESEQVFRVIVAAGQAVLAAAAEGALTIVLRHAAWLDFPTLRAIPHLVERTALSGAPLRLVLAEMDLGERQPVGHGAEDRLAVRRHLLTSLIKRLGEPLESGWPASEARAPAASPPERKLPPSRERACLDRLAAAVSPEDAVAAAIGLMRSAFFSTNYDTGIHAAHRLLAELDGCPVVDIDRVRSLVANMELGDDPGSVGVDPGAVIDKDSLHSLALRYLGMVHVFVLDYRTALRYLKEAADRGPSIVRARARLLRALLLIKRIGAVPAGLAEVAAGLAALAGDTSDIAAVEAAWLHNVKALAHLQLRELDVAMAEEREAIRLIGKLTTTDATHLKVNLVSNVSMLKEYSRQPAAAVEVWRRFSRRSTGWGDTFFKHHAYREGGLLVRAGSLPAALPLLADAYRLAQSAGDDFYRAHMALERGRLLIDGRPGEAARLFEEAKAHATAVGDPFLLALAMAGAALASGGGLSEATRREAAALAAASTSYPEQSAEFAAALAGGTAEDVLARLPSPRTKLNRPFLTVRLDLPERV
jgi:tetratricopeptide (TPR) repeat protein